MQAAQATTGAATAAPATIDITRCIELYIKTRNTIKELDDAHKAKMAPYREALEKMNGVLLSHLNTIKSDSSSVRGVGTVYKTTNKSASIADPASFRRFVIGGEHWDLIDFKANAPAVEAFVKEHKSLPPGVNFTQVDVVGVRKA